MPRRRDVPKQRSDPRFDRYRDRVGRLYQDGHEVGLVLVLAEPFADKVAGHEWWRRFAEPRHVLSLWTIIDDTFYESLVLDEYVAKELAAYDEGRFSHYGETLDVVWLDQDESARLRATEFGR